MYRSVSILAKNKGGKYLLQMRDGTKGICNPLKWNFFGGKIEGSEDILLATTREFFEETGIKINSEDCEIKGEMKSPDNGGIVYLVEIKRNIDINDVKLGEGTGVGSFFVDEMKRIDITDQTRRQIEQFVES